MKEAVRNVREAYEALIRTQTSVGPHPDEAMILDEIDVPHIEKTIEREFKDGSSFAIDTSKQDRFLSEVVSMNGEGDGVLVGYHSRTMSVYFEADNAGTEDVLDKLAILDGRVTGITVHVAGDSVDDIARKLSPYVAGDAANSEPGYKAEAKPERPPVLPNDGDGYVYIDVVAGAEHGLHMRVAKKVSEIAHASSSELQIIKPGGEPVDGRSSLDIIAYEVKQGTQITLRAKGPDANALLCRLLPVIQEGVKYEQQS